MARPERLIVVAGTGTEVGKTWVGAAVLTALRAKGRRVAARKPVQSFEPGERGATDAEVLAAASGEAPTDVCRPERWCEVPMAPPMAAEVLGRPAFTTDELADEIEWPDRTEVGLIETAGGVRSPLASDGDTVDLVEAVAPDHVLLVADAGLGTLNLVRLSVDALAGAGVPTVVYLNRFDADDDLHCRNREWIEERMGLTAVTTAAEVVDRLLL